MAAKCAGALYTVAKDANDDLNVVATGRLLVLTDLSAMETEATVLTDNGDNKTGVKSVGVNKDFILASAW